MIRLNCDYLEGCHPAILEALARTNLEQTPGYGLDVHCDHAADLLREAFSCPDAAVHFLVGGTQVNAVAISAALRPFEGVLCADTGHINVHETGAIEATGHKVLPLPGTDGKITGEQIRRAVALQDNFEHTVRPGMVYISFPTEVGTLYSLCELQDVYAACRETGLLLYIDGARLGYGLMADANDVTPAQIAANCDAFTVGGTKVGALFGEALIINSERLNRDIRYMIKRQGGMLAKGRLLGIQFEALMQDGLYFTIGRKAAVLADRIREALLRKGIPLDISSPTNQLFPVFTDEQAAELEKQGIVLEFEGRRDDRHVCLRVCTSWATTDAMADEFIEAVGKL